MQYTLKMRALVVMKFPVANFSRFKYPNFTWWNRFFGVKLREHIVSWMQITRWPACHSIFIYKIQAGIFINRNLIRFKAIRGHFHNDDFTMSYCNSWKHEKYEYECTQNLGYSLR